MKFPNKIPTIAGLFLVFLMVGFIIVFTEGAVRIPTRASESQQPNDVQFSNVTDASFTVSWLTNTPTTGSILISSEGKSNRMQYDERDTVKTMGKYTTHSVTYRDGKANTEYSIKILSNGRQYSNNNVPFTIQTASTLPTNTNALEPAYGTILSATGSPADGALVYLTFEGGQQLSTLTKKSGLWLIPLSNVRTNDLSGFLSTSDKTVETIVVKTATGQIRVTTDPLNDSPVPDVTVGKTYDFRGQQINKRSGKDVALRITPSVGGAVLAATATTKTFKVSLDTPAEGASLPTTLPLIAGTGIPNTFVGISLGITSPQSGSTKVKADGTWNFTPTKRLSPGKQSVTITTVDEKQKTVALTHSFQILKSGTQVLGDATPSATLTLTITPTLESSQTATPTPTEVVTETPEESTLAGEPIPATGNELPTIILLLVGFALFTTGLVAIKF